MKRLLGIALVNWRLIAALGLVLAVIVLVFASYPLLALAKRAWEETGVKSRLVTSMSAKGGQLQSLDRERLSNVTTTATQALPQQIGVLAALSRIREAAQDYNMTITRIQVSIQEEKEALSIGGFRVDVEGVASNLRPFLAEVGRSLPYIRVLSGRMSKVEDLVKVSISLETYWKKFPDKLPGIEEPVPRLTTSEEQFLVELATFKGRTKAPTPLVPGEGRPNPFEF